ncbi:MAG: cytochrome c biogenesis protein CcdA [Bacteroidia bacterium]|nr:cytochrome c biogenesis protein CcdA [Bacteroidia bacterium]
MRNPAMFFFFFLMNISVFAQFENAVSLDHTIKPKENLAVGDVITLSITASIDPGYHMYSAKQTEKMAMIAATFDLDKESKGVEIVGKLDDEGHVETAYDDIFEDNISLYHDEVTYIQKLKITAENPQIAGYLSYQVCNDSRCIPSSYDVVLAIKTVKKNTTPLIEPKSAKVEITQPEKNQSEITQPEKTQSVVLTTLETAPKETEVEPVVETENITPPVPRESLWILILKGLALGFGSVLTPCVFPLIPLTVSFFTKQSTNRAKGIRNASLYGLSIVLIYTVLGLIVSALFGPDAMRQLSVSPGFNIALFAFIFIFGLSFLGMFEITLPSSWSTALSKGSDKGGLIGIFLMAMTLAIVSFSCTGPLVFTALADAAGGSEFIRPVAAMLAYSSALALPFVFFAIFPGYMNSLPNSGGWLNSVKVVLGLLEIALAFIYLSRADLVMHWGLLDREIFIGAWVVIFSMLGLYLLGKISLPHDSPVSNLSVPRFLMAMGAFWFVTYLIPGLWGAPLNMLGGYIPESNKQMGVMILDGQISSAASSSESTYSSADGDICNYPDKISDHLSEGTPKGFCAFYDLEQGLEYARKVNKPVFLDFTGHTCANCRYLEKNAWVDPQVSQYIREEFVLISLYTDDREKLPETETTPDGYKLRTVGDKWIQYERDVYRQNAQPYYVLLDHDKSNLIEPTGYNPPLNVQEYRDFFARGLEEFQKRHSL